MQNGGTPHTAIVNAMACLIRTFLTDGEKLKGPANYLIWSFGTYRKIPKKLDIRKICCNHPKILTTRLYHRVILLKDADRITNSVDPDQTAPLLPRPVCQKT